MRVAKATSKENKQHGSTFRLVLVAFIVIGTLASKPWMLIPSTESTKHVSSDDTAGSQETLKESVAAGAAVPAGVCSFRSAHLFFPQIGQCAVCLSQGNQDMILHDIFNNIGVTNRQCVEFGFGYTRGAESFTMEIFRNWKKIASGLNIHRLVMQGWNHVLFDAEFENPAINLVKAVLTEANIASEFEKAGVEKEADYVSIDVDSVDIWLLRGLLEGGYRPRVMTVEHNPNFAANETLACEPQWAPWIGGSRVYGTSAAAIQHVAKQYGYVVVEIMHHLDVFLIRKDILQARCSNFDQLPSFEDLAEGTTDVDVHRFCDLNTQGQRLVDVPLYLAGKHDDAKQKAQQVVQEMNKRRIGRGEKAFCT